MLLEPVYKYGMIGALLLAVGLGGKGCWDQHRLKETQKDLTVAQSDARAAQEANKAQGTVITALIAADVQKAKFNADRQQIIERHYTVERQIAASVDKLQKERTDANLADGALSPDLKLVLRQLRQQTAEYNRQAGVGGETAPDRTGK